MEAVPFALVGERAQGRRDIVEGFEGHAAILRSGTATELEAGVR
jgi:hypothetical protein